MPTHPASPRLAHIKAHLQHGFDVTACVDNVSQGTGSLAGSLLELSSHAFAMAMIQWFEDHDINAAKEWFHRQAWLTRLRANIDVPSSITLSYVWQLLPSLVSGGNDVLLWDEHFGKAAERGSVFHDVTTELLFGCAYGVLRKDAAAIKRLVGRVEPTSRLNEKYKLDLEFFAQLIQGDTSAIAKSIAAVADRSQERDRIGDESGYTQGLISTPACLYALLASFAGYDVPLVHSLVPHEWVSLSRSRTEYEAPYGFVFKIT